MKRIVELFGASCCCLVLGVTAANADSPRLSEAELDRVTAGNLFEPTPVQPIVTPIDGSLPPPPLFPPPSAGFELGEGLLNPPPPPAPLPPVTPPSPPANGSPANGAPPETAPPPATFREQLRGFSQNLRGRF